MTKLIYNYDQDAYYLGSQKADLDPLESKIQKQDIHLLPGNATFTQMNLKPKENKRIKWNGQKWIYEDLPPAKTEIIPTDEEQIDQLKNTAIGIRRSYLYSTDWYILREYDQPDSYPENIKSKRILVRKQINEIESIDQLLDAQNIEKNHKFLTNTNQQ